MSTHDNNQNHAFWEGFYERQYGQLMLLARRLVNGKYDVAEDLVQATVCRALVYCKDPAKVNNPAAYLFTIMRNVWIDKYKNENMANIESLNALSNVERLGTVEPEAHDILENEELRSRLRLTRGPLTVREQRLLTLYLEGYKCSEIADELNEDVRIIRCDLNAVKAKIRYRLTKRSTHHSHETPHADRETQIRLKGRQEPFPLDLDSQLVA